MESVAVIRACVPGAAGAGEARKLALRGQGVDREQRMLEHRSVDDVLLRDVAV